MPTARFHECPCRHMGGFRVSGLAGGCAAAVGTDMQAAGKMCFMGAGCRGGGAVITWLRAPAATLSHIRCICNTCYVHARRLASKKRRNRTRIRRGGCRYGRMSPYPDRSHAAATIRTETIDAARLSTHGRHDGGGYNPGSALRTAAARTTMVPMRFMVPWHVRGWLLSSGVVKGMRCV